jgi:hypothetical protein
MNPIATSGTKWVKIECVVTKLMSGEPLEGAATIEVASLAMESALQIV